MSKRSLLAVAVCSAAVMGMGANAALAGEVKGPPGDGTTQDGGNPNKTGALDHANSACAASGLNDYDLDTEGQNESQVQTAADSWKYYGLPKGAVGEACRGGGPKDR